MNHKHPLDNINAIGTLVLAPFFLMASVLWLAQIILADIDRFIAAAPSRPGDEKEAQR